MKEKVKALWKLCFDDSDQFIDMYFRLRYKSEINVVIESGNEVISALQMLPYPMSFCGKQVATSYISGACVSFYHKLLPECYRTGSSSVH